MKSLLNFLVIVGMLLSLLGAEAVSADGFSCSSVTDVPVVECEALVALYNSTNGAGWTNRTNWLETVTVGNWYGITVESGHVVGIYLGENHLTGTLPAALGSLSNLRYLNLFNNQLSGSIPPELGSLSNLTDLDLGGNQLSGSIPRELGSLSNLTYLNLFDNQLSGSIPPELGSLSNLQYLNLGNNQLSGSIPPELGSLSNLTFLYLFDNQLSGSIPAALGNLNSLKHLWLSNNQLSGEVPGTLMNLTSLTELDLDYNRLTVPGDYPNPSNPLHVFLSQKAANWHLHQAVSQQIAPDSGGTITSRDGAVQVQVPKDALDDTVTFTFIPQAQPSQSSGELAFANQSFQLIAENSSGSRVRVFNKPLTVTINYNEADLGGASEDDLRLFYWDEESSAWKDAATTCTPPSIYRRNLEENRFSVDI